MRRKQIGPELKLFELDTLKYVTFDNVKDSIYYIGIFPERMSPADVTFARKSGLLESSNNRLYLSEIALHLVLGAMTYREYAFLMLSKQWIKTTNVGGRPTEYNEPLLSFILKEIQLRGHMCKTTFTQELDALLAVKYAPIVLSNSDSLRYVKGLLVSSELVVEKDGYYLINPLVSAIVQDFVTNSDRIKPPTEETEYESFWNTLDHGVFDIIYSGNKKLYSSFYSNIIK